VETLIAKLEKGAQKTHEILSRLTADRWQAAVYTEPCPWTVRDMLAHFLSAEKELLRMTQDIASGRTGAPEGFDLDAFNAQEQERLAGRSPQDLLDALSVARQATMDWVRTLDEEELDRVGRHPALGETSLEIMITAMYGHQLLHMRDLQRAWERSR
jgi:hypothetical protein